jgi:hypothetical protein
MLEKIRGVVQNRVQDGAGGGVGRRRGVCEGSVVCTRNVLSKVTAEVPQKTRWRSLSARVGCHALHGVAQLPHAQVPEWNTRVQSDTLAGPGRGNL